MGVPRLFRFLSQRYPCLVDDLTNNQSLDFDHLYLDMNGIIHQCLQCLPSNYDSVDGSFSEEDVYKSIFYYVEILFNFVKPKKLLFMAVDGVAPQAKLNNQRARRFMKAKEKEIETKRLLAKGKKVNPNSFDSNHVSPGTPFMESLHSQLQFFVANKVSTDPLWQRCKVILSGHQTPGEGEHKIMDYLRYLRSRPDHDPSLRHCIFGSDADLMMLVLSTHESNFFIIREKADYSKKRMKTVDEIEFQLINVPFLRDYLDLEFEDLKEKLPFPYDLDSIVDDWILMTFLLGNDFIPKLPDLYIGNLALPIFYKTYKDVLPTLEGYLNENGILNLPRFQEFVGKLADHDLEAFEEAYADLNYLESKMGRSLTEAKEEEPKTGRKSDVEALIKATNDMLKLSDSMSDDNEGDYDDFDQDTFLLEFCQKKKNYYSDKMGFPEVTDEVMKSQAEGYIRAIQWNLYYYFHGCKSWNWFYPHHYCPYISDVVNFKDCPLDFDLGQPLEQFEQLMAIIPPASKDCIPEVFHHLMTSPESPIIDFYPEDFETDLKAEQYQWEAVILIPFVDQKRLKEAMAPFKSQLKEEERNRNKHSPMHLYTYTDENLGKYISPGYFPDLVVNHAHRVDLLRSDIIVEPSKLRFIRIADLTSVNSDVLKHFPYKGSLKPIKVKVLNMPSREDSLVLTLDPQETPSLDELAKKLLGKIVYVNWPNLIEAKVTAISSAETRVSLGPDGKIGQESLGQDLVRNWTCAQELLTEHYIRRKGVDIGETKIIVYANHLEGRKYSFTKGKATLEKFWASNATPWPLQTVVQNHVKGYGQKDIRPLENLNDAFPASSTVFILNKKHFGARGRVLERSDSSQKGLLDVAVEIVTDIRTEQFINGQKKTNFLTCKTAATNIGISCRLLGRITGCILVFPRSEGGENSDKEDCKTFNIGLKMKWPKRNEELPGYTKKENNFWVYSAKAIQVVSRYVKAFPKVFEYIASNMENQAYYMDEGFPVGTKEMEEMVDWIEDQDYQKIHFVSCGSEIVDPQAVEELEKAVSVYEKKVTVKTVAVQPEHLYKSDLYMGNVLPARSNRHCLYDRVVSIKSPYTVPTGLRGVIIGIHKVSVEQDDYMYDVLFDEPFTGGLKLYTKDNRVYKLPEHHFLNLTNPNRSLPKKVAVETAVSVQNELKQFQLRMEKPEPTSPSSAFAQWNHPKQNSQDVSKPVQILRRSPAKTKPNEDFQKMWANLQNGKPQQETMALKQLLKIGQSDELSKGSDSKEQSKAVDVVKSFFQNLKIPPKDSSSGTIVPPYVSAMPPISYIPSPGVMQQTLPGSCSAPRHPGSYPPSSQPPRPSQPYHPPSSQPFPPPPAQPPIPPQTYPLPPSQPPFPGHYPPPSGQPVIQTPSPFYTQLCIFYGQRNMPFPKYNSFRLHNKIAIQLICADGKIFSSLPMDDECSALESAARNALLSLGLISEGDHQRDKNWRIKENQHKLYKALTKEEKVLDKQTITLRPDTDPTIWRTQPQQQQQKKHSNNAPKSQVPQGLPLPPQNWVTGSSTPKKSSLEQDQQKNRSPDKDSRKKTQEGKKPKVGNQKVSDSALGFVPLQAITGKRNFKPIVTTQTPASPKTNASADRIVKEIQDSKATHNQLREENANNTKPKTQRPRHRIAANLNLDPNLY